MKAPDKIYVEVCEDGIFAFPDPPFEESIEYIRADLVSCPKSSDTLEEASRNVYESWMGGAMNDVRRDMVELGKVLNARKEESK